MCIDFLVFFLVSYNFFAIFIFVKEQKQKNKCPKNSNINVHVHTYLNLMECSGISPAVIEGMGIE